MKKLLLTALCALSLNATAQTFGVGLAYEHDSATTNAIGLESVSKAGLLAGLVGKYGQLDASLFEVTVRGKRFHDTQQGGEVGYGHGLNVGRVNLSARVGLGYVYGRSLGPDDTGTYATYTAAAALPLSKQLALNASARFRPDGDFDRQQLYTVGATYSFSRNLQVLGALRHTRSTGPILNGASASVRYFF